MQMRAFTPDEAAGVSLDEPPPSPLRNPRGTLTLSEPSRALSTFHREVAAACEGEDATAREAFLRMYRAGIRVAPPTCKARLQHIIASGGWVLMLFLTVIFDTIYGFAHGDDFSVAELILTLTVSFIFILDIVLRLYVFGRSVFLSKLWNIFDTTVVVLTVGLSLFIVLGGDDSPRKGQRLKFFVQMARFARFCRMTTLFRRSCPALRRVTGENKRRFVDFDQDFDLDLAYITPRLIGMSVPASGSLAWLYRNPINEVVRFFETFYSGRYLIINMCPEFPYPVNAFSTGEVQSFDVEDHTPPRIEQVVKFLELAEAWISRDENNVLAVHCRGGKGRTGSFCCAWLLYTGEAEDAQDALNYFAMRRTDTERAMGKQKVQGVETASQVRYVEYVCRLLRRQESAFPAKVRLPPRVPLQLRELRLFDTFQPPAPGELVALVHDTGKRQTLHASTLSGNTFDLSLAVVEGDTLIEVYGRGTLRPEEDLLRTCWSRFGRTPADENGARRQKKKSANGEKPARLFFFYFHTSFVDGERLQLQVSAVDRGSKTPGLLNDRGSLELSVSAL